MTQNAESKTKEETNYFNNSKVANILNQVQDLNTQINVTEFGKKKKDILSYVDFACNDISQLTRGISRFELAVMDAAYTILARGTEKFSVGDIANVMAGKIVKKNGDASKNMLEIASTLERLSTIRIHMDYTDIAREKGLISEKQKKIVTDYVLPIRGEYTTTKFSNDIKIEYKFLAKPALYEYAELLGRIVSVPASILSIQDVHETTEFIVLKQELAKEISIMKNDKNNYKNRMITYEWKKGGVEGGLYKRIGLSRLDYSSDVSWRKKKSKLQSQIAQILDSFIEQKYITGYNVVKSGNSIVGIDIEF